MTQWPDPNKPGYPVNGEKSGVHLWSDDELQNIWGLNWSPHHQQWFSRGSSMVSSKDLEERGWRYVGPAIPYAEAFTAGARAARDQAMIACERIDLQSNGADECSDKQVAWEEAATRCRDAIQSLPLPDAENAENAERFAENFAERAPENAANAGENLSATGDVQKETSPIEDEDLTAVYLRGRASVDFSGLWGLVDELKADYAPIMPSRFGNRLEAELTKMGVTRP